MLHSFSKIEFLNIKRKSIFSSLAKKQQTTFQWTVPFAQCAPFVFILAIMTSSEIFWNHGHKTTCHNLRGSICMGYRLFRSFFGTSPQVCAILWDILSTQRPPNSTPKHLLWGLLLLKQYNIESINAVLVGASEKTFRKWSLIYVRLIANLSVVKFFFKKLAHSDINIYLHF